ncbi:CHAP domain-containing protein [Planomonospora parontospora]|uniref:CHAP domain-containing protein n=1 Tax=Planomonospora parontospora TaxID=58119 RepID=UPI0016712EC2|nr:CHAP domain-containing protein [Planomonospora parontospora]GGL57474.1 hypothetical protein GCM10014719_68640 [Planomonospora parontospora subsp. antibiotica]GII20001.1 hypothetical protein Ppa05_67270 [Planomonospora parontospora subsp. antibiotica]
MSDRHVFSPLLPDNLLRAAVCITFITCALPIGAPAFMADAPQQTQPDDARLSKGAAPPPAGKLPPKKPTPAESLLKVAEKQIGITENTVGGGTKFHSWYMASQRAQETLARDGGVMENYANAPWCAMFISWVGEQAGLRSVIGADAYAIAWAGWFQDRHRWGHLAKPGALVYFDLDSDDDRGIYKIDHMGLVERDNEDGTITTIEGNTDKGKVERRIRPTSDVVGYGYPRYPSPAKAATRHPSSTSPPGPGTDQPGTGHEAGRPRS